MMSNDLDSSGFFFPMVFKKNDDAVVESLKAGNFDLISMTQWSFADEFLCFTLKSKLLQFLDETFPNPRLKNEVPIWFLISTQFLLRIHQSVRYSRLKTLLRSGSVLTKVGFNVGSKELGFNQKNKKPRSTAVDPDTVRKFFKDTDPRKMRSWFNSKVQNWFVGQKSFHQDGIFLLDQTKIVVPHNKNYEDAVRMPVDEFGHFYNTHGLSEDQKKALPHHPCYTMSTLLHTDKNRETLHVAGYDFGPGNEDELPQAERLVVDFCTNFPGKMKLLIMDKGYVDGEFISKIKTQFNVDCLLPLKKNMTNFTDAISIAERLDEWELAEEILDSEGELIRKTMVHDVADMELWDACKIKIHTTVLRTTRWSKTHKEYRTHDWVLGSTKKFNSPKAAFLRYKIRTEIEERYRQFKFSWSITKFPSPSKSLMESHLCFTLLTYSMLELYLRRHQLQAQIRKMISTLRQEESLGKDTVIVYHQGEYTVLSLKNYTQIITALSGNAREQLAQNIYKIEES